MFFAILGIICFLGAIVLGFYLIKEVTLPLRSSRIVALACAIMGYFVFSTYMSNSPYISYPSVSNFWLKYVPWVVFIGLGIVLVTDFIRHIKAEFKEITCSSLWLLLIVALFIVARFCFAWATWNSKGFTEYAFLKSNHRIQRVVSVLIDEISLIADCRFDVAMAV